MLNSKPKTMAVFLRNVGQKQYSRRLIVKRFNEEILLAIVKILEPEQFEFIADYITEAKENNKKARKSSLGFKKFFLLLFFSSFFFTADWNDIIPIKQWHQHHQQQ